jgi:putative transposase
MPFLVSMPRKPRLIVPEWPVHIIQRGNDRMTCFREEGDYLVYLALLRQISKKTGCEVHAYCLMSNHIHLLVTPQGPDACSGLMKELAQRYSYYFNHKHRRTGPLWEGRFRSCVIESSRYAVACYRYIELNPVRAGIVSHPAAYPWSSYAVSSGSRRDPMVSPHPELSAIGASAYIRLVTDAVDPDFLREIREATNGGYPLGGRVIRGRAGRPRKSTADSQERKSEERKSVSDTDLFSGGGVS